MLLSFSLFLDVPGFFLSGAVQPLGIRYWSILSTCPKPNSSVTFTLVKDIYLVSIYKEVELLWMVQATCGHSMCPGRS